MADTAISALSAAAALTGTEQVPIVQSAATVRTTVSAIRGAPSELKISRGADQSINTSTLAAISFDTETTDTNGLFAPTSTTITIPTGQGGVWVITAQALVTGGDTAGGTRAFVQINQNAGTKQYRAPFPINDDITTMSITVRLAQADTLTFEVFQSSGGARNMKASLEMYRLAA